MKRPWILWVLVAASASTLLLTWPLWQSRAQPPVLPAWALLAHVDFGATLLVTLALTAWRPRIGACTHAALLALACVGDQCRLQPQQGSLAILLVGVTTAPALARAHLIALWCFAGAHKLLSTGYRARGGEWLLGTLGIDASAGIASAIGIAAAVLEVALAVAVVVPRTRRVAAWCGAGAHTAIAVFLIAVAERNPAVWAWNGALAAASVALFLPWRDAPIAAFRRLSIATRAAVLVVLVSPVGFYLGLVDAFLAHCLYADNTPRAMWIDRDGGIRRVDELPSLRVYLPPEPRLFHAWFDAHARPGDRMVVIDENWWAPRRERIHARE